MNLRPLFKLALASLKNRIGTVLLTLLTIALSVTLFLGVEKMRHGTKASFEATISGTDLIVGARSAPVNLLLASVFRIGNVPANISWKAAQEIAARNDVAWSVPLSLGDSHRGERVLGTVPEYFTYYKYGNGQQLEFAEGAGFSDLFDIVLGAETAKQLGYTLGDEIELTHGLGQAGISDHDDLPFKVSGILKPTGTPVDRTLHTSIEAISAIHGGWEGHSDHQQESDIDLTPQSVSAILIGLENKASILRTKRALDTYSDEALLAVMPGPVLLELWALTGLAERALLTVSALVVLVGLISALVGLLSGLSARRREMAILRAVGARPGHIGGLMVTEAVLMGFGGACIGVLFVYIGLGFAGPLVTARWGIVLTGIGPGLFDVAVIIIITCLSALMGLVPAAMTYRRALGDGLSVKL
jgi:putative ABC transport system permease protein